VGIRIGRKIEEFASGEEPDFQPARNAMKSPGLTPEQAEFLVRRGQKHACHSDNVSDSEAAKEVQKHYVELNVAVP